MTQTASVAASLPELFPGRWRALSVLLVALFMVLLDTSIVTNALNTIQHTLSATSAEVQFVLSGYAVAYGVLLITGGRLGDLYGRKRAFLLGLTGFVVTSALCGLAWSPLTLILFRILQGLTAALLFPQVSSFIQVLFPVEERPRAFGLLGAVIGLGIIAGPLLGGVLIDANLFGSTWRSIFLINIPIGLLTLFFAARFLPESQSVSPSKAGTKGLDVLSVLLLTLGLLLLTYPVIQGRDEGWPLWIFLLLAASIPVLGLFIWRQRRLSAQQRPPLAELSLFQNRAFLIDAIITFVFQSSVLSYFVAMSLFFQAGLGFSPTRAALTLIAYQVSIAVASLLSAPLTRQLGRNVLLIGMGLLTVGLVLSLWILNQNGMSYQGYELIPALILGGGGFGLVVAPLQSVILSGVHPIHAGSASGILATLQQVGTALGVAIVGTLLFGHLANQSGSIAANERPALTRNLIANHLPGQAVSSIIDRFDMCIHDRFNQLDLTAVPASCHSSINKLPPKLQQTVSNILLSSAENIRHANFLSALLFSLRYQLVVYVVCFGLIMMLPLPVDRR